MVLTSEGPNIAIVILAAGASTRMGSPKQLLRWGDNILLMHAVNEAEKSKANEVFVILGANHEKITDKVKPSTATILINNDWELGLGSSIAYGVLHLQNSNKLYDGILLMLADQPKVDTNYLNSIIKKFKVGRKQIIATTYDTQFGVPAVFDQIYFKELSKLTGDKGAKNIIEENLAYLTTSSPKSKLIDIDTKEAYDKLYSKNFKNQ